MRCWYLIGGCALGLLLFERAIAEAPKEEPETVTIPRDEIVLGGPGSRQFRDLEPELMVRRDTPEKIAKYSTPEGFKEFTRLIEKGRKESLVLAIERAMNSMPMGKDAKKEPGFAVEGQGRAALQGIYDVLVKSKEPQQCLGAGKELSLVFYNRPMQAGIRLDNVTRTGEVFKIQYMLLSKANLSMSWSLALIPLGKLPPGEYRVNMERRREKEAEFNPRGFPPIPVGMEKRLTCQPFSFTVTNKLAKE